MAREAGYEAHAIDLFGDEDTRAAARATTALTPNRHFDFCAEELLGAIAAQQALRGPMPVICGSAFECAPAPLDELARHYQLLGCTAEVYRRLRVLPDLFDALRRDGIATPRTHWHAPARAQGWLRKRVGGSGGYHVAPAQGVARVSRGHYFQQRAGGTSRSALFIANGRECRFYGCAEHLRWHTNPGFRYEGARRVVRVPVGLRHRLERIGAILTARLGLRGCFGIDFLLHHDSEPVLVDINPRPTATLELYPERHRMFAAHLAACTDQTLLYSSPQDSTHRAHLVLYADAPWHVIKGLLWPDWIADRPPAGTVIPRGAPLCTLQAEGATRSALEHTLRQRYHVLRARLGASAQSVLPTTINIRTM